MSIVQSQFISFFWKKVMEKPSNRRDFFLSHPNNLSNFLKSGRGFQFLSLHSRNRFKPTSSPQTRVQIPTSKRPHLHQIPLKISFSLQTAKKPNLLHSFCLPLFISPKREKIHSLGSFSQLVMKFGFKPITFGIKRDTTTT